MDKSQMIEQLIELAQADQNALGVYDEAVHKIDGKDVDIQERLMLFRNDHSLHLNVISQAVEELGGTPREMKADGAGRAMQDRIAALRPSDSTGVLKVMQEAASLVRRAYARLVESPDFETYSDDLREHLLHNFDDEKHHLDYVESKLESLAVTA